MVYYRTIRKYESKLQPYQRNLQTLLDKSFPDESKIDEILFCVFNIISIRRILYRKFQCFNKGASLAHFLGLQSFQDLRADKIVGNYLRKERALFSIVQREGEQYDDFFRKVTLKHAGCLCESIIIYISPLPYTLSLEKQLRNLLYKLCFMKLSLYDSEVSLCKIKRKINGLFKRENHRTLKQILFYIVKHGNHDYWRNKTVHDLFL